MKRLIPFLASNYRKDKIWMRRQKPNKRTYQVILAVDDSKSMTQNKCGESALVAMACIARLVSWEFQDQETFVPRFEIFIGLLF